MVIDPLEQIKRSFARLISDNCGGNFSTDIGTFSSPNYPADYPDNKECVTTITVNPNKVVKLNFHRYSRYWIGILAIRTTGDCLSLGSTPFV